MLRQTKTLLISRSLRKQRNRGNAAFETQEARLVTFPHLVMSFLFCFCFVLFFSRSSANLELPEMNEILKSSLSFMRFTDHQGRTQTELFLRVQTAYLSFFSVSWLLLSSEVISSKVKTTHAANVHLRPKRTAFSHPTSHRHDPKQKLTNSSRDSLFPVLFLTVTCKFYWGWKILSLLKSGRKLHSSHEINLCVLSELVFPHVKLISVFRPGFPHSTSFFPIVAPTNSLRGALLLLNTAGPLLSLACFHYLQFFLLSVCDTF